ncbi:hypothetical protein AALP_AA3G034800 [Arabis alpina]|uniref:RRM domain-containing protein n=1 Tax=Arabis alpina TaxID=50452 RepID=A0A087H6S9_ARAAL|nr:hypothetical protein AALP_AA3G034800 [Arabis alpina]
MHRSAMKGMELNASDADHRKIGRDGKLKDDKVESNGPRRSARIASLRDPRMSARIASLRDPRMRYCKRVSRIPTFPPKKDDNRRRTITMIVSGYDKSLPEDTIQSLLREHFSSCGKIRKVYIHAHVDSKIDNKYAFVDIIGVGAKEKALELSGSDVGGHKLLVKFKPVTTLFGGLFTPEKAVRWSELNEFSRQHPAPTIVLVSGYPTGLPEESLRSVLSEHFSSCGEIDHVTITHNRYLGGLSDTAAIHFCGEVAAEKARELSGSDMGGWKVDVVHCSGPRDVPLNQIFMGRGPHVPIRGRGGRLF